MKVAAIHLPACPKTKCALAFGLLWSILQTAHANAATTTIAPGPTTIHTAVAAAAAGDTIILSPGRYALDSVVNIRKPIVIMSQTGPENTVVDLQLNLGSVFFVRPMVGGPTIQGLTIMRGAQAATAAGAGVYVSGANIKLINNLVIGNVASNIEGKGGLGAGVYVNQSDVVIRNNTIAGNESGGGGIFLSACTGQVDHNVIAYNSDGHPNSSDGFGLSCYETTAAIADNMFWANLPLQIDPLCNIPLSDNGNIVLDPKYCNPQYWPAIMQSDWHPADNSPLAPGHQYFGWGATYSTCGTTSVSRTSWGQVKSHYRE